MPDAGLFTVQKSKNPKEPVRTLGPAPFRSWREALTYSTEDLQHGQRIGELIIENPFRGT
uniref:Uncharacterized protein n=1 Tax=Candidatus Kentrum sp. TUN TaxID=2126343 RepID=A0A450ZXC5_9GAMM|nr:MAG: hypothetical protein BECKTUN1418F_GA0071002_11237 [Candidatus Kentron sp. TUN]VFK58386.1 MAG: hypothetical protein BECKTUN1418D_GA0071000_10824 [Candidatus Kentron sp. TUN]VFK65985.1 MAG: hypothetical protein BECKTUN1418E_GA0071001_11187 [Candidatus Kentron sp. TUN]